MLRFVRPILAAALLVFAHVSANAQTSYSEGGYANATSFAPGSTVELRIATSQNPFDVQIVNLANPTQVLTTIRGLSSTTRDCTGLWENGCGWPVTTTFTIPTNWRSGYYAARFPTSLGRRQIIFVVRAATPGSTSSFVVVSPTNTYVAYNMFGGKSVYDTRSTNSQRAGVVSYLRPYSDSEGLGWFPLWEQQFVDWMTAEGRTFEVVTDDDLANPATLSAYAGVILLGHSEYWTLTARENLENFSEAGGHIAVFGGNAMWWQARTDLQTRQFTCYKDATLDPLTPTRPDLATVNWYNRPVFNPENFILGASFRNGGFANSTGAGSATPLPNDQRTPYTVRNPTSWIFDRTGVTRGQAFGQAAGGTEVDGAIFNTDAAGNLLVDGSDGTPLNFDILATLPGDSGYGTIGFYSNANGGGVFTAGTRDWSHGLQAGDPVVQQMARNIIDRISSRQPFPYQPRTSPDLTKDLFNTPSPMTGVLPGWRGSMLQSSLTLACSHEGPLGLQLTGTAWTQFRRRFIPDAGGIAAAEVSFYLNADQITQAPVSRVPIVDLQSRITATEVVYASIEIQDQAPGKGLRLALRRADGTRTVATSWVLIPAGWQLIRASWRSPGTVELRVGALAPVQASNPESGQTVNEVMVEFPGSNAGLVGSMCVDELTVRTTVGSAAGATSTVSANPTSIIANGTSTSTITVTLKDAAGTTLSSGGDDVDLSTTGGTLSSVIDGGNGTYRATLTSPTQTGSATISGTVNGTPVGNAATVAFVAGPAAGSTSTIAASPTSIIANGTSTSTVTLTLKDANGNNLSGGGATVQLTTTAGTLSAVTDLGNGSYRATLTSPTQTGSATISGTVSGAAITSTANVTFTPGPASSATSTIAATPTSIVANGTSTSTITVTLKDASGNNLTTGGDTVQLTANRGTLSAVSDLGNGTYRATLTSTTQAGTSTVSGTVNGVAIASTATVTFVAGAAASLVLAAPATASSGTAFEVTVTVVDASGNVAEDFTGTVRFQSDDAAATLPPDYAYTAADKGRHIFSGVVLRTAGTRSLTVTPAASGPSSGTASITVRAATTTTLSSSPNPARSGQTISLRASVSSTASGPAITGSVRFDDGSTSLGTATVNGGAASLTTSALSAGTHSITATYLGDSVYDTSTSSPVSQSITESTGPLLDAETVSAGNIVLTWTQVSGAARYVIERSSGGAPFVAIGTVSAPAVTYQDVSVQAGTTYLYRVRGHDSAGNAGVASAIDLATTTVFSAPVAGGVIRASDIIEIRTVIDALRRAAGLAPAAYSRTVAAGLTVLASDITEMRAAADAARIALGLGAYPYGETVGAGVPMRALHFRELEMTAGAKPPS